MYNFSISGHALTDEDEWQFMQALAKVVQDFKCTGAYGSTQFHGEVNLTSVQVFIPSLVEPAPKQEEHAVSDTYDTTPLPDGGEVLTPSDVGSEHTEAGEGEVKQETQPDGKVQTVVTNAAGETVGFQ